MTVFVTSADEFIGFCLVERLIKLGQKIKAFIFYIFRGLNSWLVKKIYLVLIYLVVLIIFFEKYYKLKMISLKY